jgi:hypothetical protein
VKHFEPPLTLPITSPVISSTNGSLSSYTARLKVIYPTSQISRELKGDALAASHPKRLPFKREILQRDQIIG